GSLGLVGLGSRVRCGVVGLLVVGLLVVGRVRKLDAVDRVLVFSTDGDFGKRLLLGGEAVSLLLLLGLFVLQVEAAAQCNQHEKRDVEFLAAVHQSLPSNSGELELTTSGQAQTPTNQTKG